MRELIVRPRRAIRLALLAAVVAALVCFMADTSQPAKASGGDPTHTTAHVATPIMLHVGFSPVVELAPLYLAQKLGYFRQHGVQVVAEPNAGGGPVVVPAMLAGQLQLINTSWGTILGATAEGLPIKVVAPASEAGTTSATDTDHLVASGINSVKGLAGATIAVPSLNNLPSIETDALLKANGVDPSSVHYDLVPYTAMGAALQNGSVKAAWIAEPYYTQLLQQYPTLDDLGGTDLAIAKNLPTTAYVTTTSYYNSNRAAITDFQKALAEADAYAAAHPAAVRLIATTYTSITPALAEDLILPTYNAPFNAAAVQKLANLAFASAIIPKAVTVSTVIAPDPSLPKAGKTSPPKKKK